MSEDEHKKKEVRTLLLLFLQLKTIRDLSKLQ